jgi:hypothetical protein
MREICKMLLEISCCGRRKINSCFICKFIKLKAEGKFGKQSKESETPHKRSRF